MSEQTPEEQQALIEKWIWENRLGGMFHRAGDYLGCFVCGAVVTDQNVHYGWHMELKARLK